MMVDPDRQQRLALLDFESPEQAEALADMIGEKDTVSLSCARSARRSADANERSAEANERIASAMERLATTAEAREARESGGGA